METNTELLNRIEAHIKGRLAVAESRAASSELYEGKKIAYNSILGVVRSLRADCAAQAQLVPSDVQEAAEKYAAEQTPVEYPNLYDEGAIKTAYADGMLAERERLMKEAVEGEIVKDISGKLGVTAKVNLDGFKFGEKVRVIIEEIK